MTTSTEIMCVHKTTVLKINMQTQLRYHTQLLEACEIYPCVHLFQHLFQHRAWCENPAVCTMKPYFQNKREVIIEFKSWRGTFSTSGPSVYSKYKKTNHTKDSRNLHVVLWLCFFNFTVDHFFLFLQFLYMIFTLLKLLSNKSWTHNSKCPTF